MVAKVAGSGEAKEAISWAFVVSIALAVMMILMALGFMSMLDKKEPGEIFHWPSVVTGTITLVVFALSFVASAVLLDRAGMEQVETITVGAILALGITIFVLTIYIGIKYISDGMVKLDNDTLLTGFAIALIAGVIIDRLVLKF